MKSNTEHRMLSIPETQLQPNKRHILRLIAVSGTTYEKEFVQFAKRINPLVAHKGIKIEIVKSTSPSLARLLFNNNDSSHTMDHKCHINNCSLRHSGIINKSGEVVSTVTGNKYRVDETLSCTNGGIYVITGKCLRQYSGKTIHFGVRANEYFCRNASSIHKHKQECSSCNDARDFSICFVENYLNIVCLNVSLYGIIE